MQAGVYIDTHCHLDAIEFDADRDEQRRLARVRGVQTCVIPAVTQVHWAGVADLAHRHGDVYALGIHPLYVTGAQTADAELLAQALSRAQNDPALVAVGEIGLDGFDGHPDMELQLHWFRLQLGLARDFGLPVILHVRRSVDLVLRELRRCPVVGGIAHAFNGSEQQAQALMDWGFVLGFGGALTFERALQLRRLATKLPLSGVVLETDAPDIPPQWLYRTAHQRAQGMPQGRNSPAELPRIAECWAALRDIDPIDLARTCADNARRVLRWPHRTLA
ncbi:MAG: TatD family hydrolase [Alphaproteobacteria bacterium]|nr:TatD family hydrolase [Alphaproteobacteria bacterium]